MPYVSLPGSVQLYYELHTTPSSSNTPKPGLVLLSPAFLNTQLLLDTYVEAFRDDYDICTLELRAHGRSKCPAMPFDFWAMAADVAYAMESLHLAPAHIFAAGCVPFQTSVKLALLFPNLVLSLTLAGAPTLFSAPRQVEAFQEITRVWTSPADEDEWVDVIGGIGEFLLGEQHRYENAVELWDQVLPAVARKYNPWTARQVYMACVPNHRNPLLTPELLATIQHPILFFTGDNDFCFNVDDVQEDSKHFTGAKEMEFHRVEGGPHLLGITHASTVIPLMQPFLARNSPSSPQPFTPPDALAGLRIAASIAQDPKVANRNAHHPDSFSLLTQKQKDDFRAKNAAMEEIEKTCELVLPMCFEREDWEPPKLDEDGVERRWTWSTREDYYSHPSSPLSHPRSSVSGQGGGRPLSTFSLQDSVTVEVATSEQTHEQPAAGKAGGGLLEGLPPRLPAKESRVEVRGARSDALPPLPPVPASPRVGIAGQ
ncbi:hypothetical protein JCM8097_002889 [Rhodosporidiobolus ruineniae]